MQPRAGRLRRVWGNRNYQGALVAWAKRAAGVDLVVVAPPKGTQVCQILARRWVGERSIARHPRGDGAVSSLEQGQ
jgi:hypothetical protein